MNCKKCGKALPNEGATCNFCGTVMNQAQLRTMKQMKGKETTFQAKLMSDRYGVDKSAIYQKEDNKENKFLGAVVIVIILVILIIMAIIINIGR